MKHWYAVQTGDNYDWDYGAYSYKSAVRMARQEYLANPGNEIRIALIDETFHVCDRVVVVYEAA